MRHLKIFDNYTPTDYDNDVTKLKELLKHLITLFKNLGFDFANYYDRGTYEVEFTYTDNNKDINKYIFYLQLRVDGTSDDNLDLIIKKSISHHNEISRFVPEYFKSISGIEFINYDGRYDYRYNVPISSIKDIMGEITMNDFNLKLTANKYNM